MDKILTVNDVAEILQVKAITVREMFREKRLRGFKVGKAWRITEAMLQEDINDLAQGEAPKMLPTPSDPVAKAVPKPLATPIPAPLPEKIVAEKTPPPEVGKDESSDEDTQQMLF